MKFRVFVDGQEGTTGLEINSYLSARDDIEMLSIEPSRRKEPEARRELIDASDIVFLCLPDVAARESASLVTNGNTRIIDPSTAHRADPHWLYGLPELHAAQRDRIRESRRVAVPGCHATGFVGLLHPLVHKGILPRDYPVTSYSVTGYSGGGRSLIRKYEDECMPRGPIHYALDLEHKHLPEMQQVTGLAHPPLFTPLVADYYRGMTVSVPLLPRLLCKPATPGDLRELLRDHYSGERFVRVMPSGSEDCLDGQFPDPEGCNGTNRIDIFVFGNSERILLVSRFDNLGKGAAGAAVQNMNIMLGVDEGTGLAA